MVLVLLNTLKKVINLHVNEGTFWQCSNCPATSSNARNYNKHFHSSSERTKALLLLRKKNKHKTKQNHRREEIKGKIIFGLF